MDDLNHRPQGYFRGLIVRYDKLLPESNTVFRASSFQRLQCPSCPESKYSSE